MRDKKKAGNANLPALILLAALIMFWQTGSYGNQCGIYPAVTHADSGAIYGSCEDRFSPHIFRQPCRW